MKIIYHYQALKINLVPKLKTLSAILEYLSPYQNHNKMIISHQIAKTPLTPTSSHAHRSKISKHPMMKFLLWLCRCFRYQVKCASFWNAEPLISERNHFCFRTGKVRVLLLKPSNKKVACRNQTLLFLTQMILYRTVNKRRLLLPTN